MLNRDYCKAKIQVLGVEIAKAKQTKTEYASEYAEHLKSLRKAYEVEYMNALKRSKWQS